MYDDIEDDVGGDDEQDLRDFSIHNKLIPIEYLQK